MFGGTFSRTFRSGSTEHPTPRDLIRGLLNKLFASESKEWVHFEATDPSHWLEIANGGDSLMVKLSFPFAQSIEEVFQESGVTVPAAWPRTAYRQRGWWSAGNLQFMAPRDDLEQVVAFSEEVFQRLFRVGGDEPIKGWLAG